jgi:hypothetical protein
MIAAAHAADRHRKLTGCLLPGCGDGSLMSAAMLRARQPAGIIDEDYRRCLLVMLERLAAASAGHSGL